MYKYKNITDQEQVLMGFGTVEAGGVIETKEIVENPNFVREGEVASQVQQPTADTTSQPTANAPTISELTATSNDQLSEGAN